MTEAIRHAGFILVLVVEGGLFGKVLKNTFLYYRDQPQVFKTAKIYSKIG